MTFNRFQQKLLGFLHSVVQSKMMSIAEQQCALKMRNKQSIVFCSYAQLLSQDFFVKSCTKWMCTVPIAINDTMANRLIRCLVNITLHSSNNFFYVHCIASLCMLLLNLLGWTITPAVAYGKFSKLTVIRNCLYF